jgi:hypothetical protein
MLCDLPARSVFADTVPTLLAVPVDVAGCIPTPTFDMPARSAGECIRTSEETVGRASYARLAVRLRRSFCSRKACTQYRLNSPTSLPWIRTRFGGRIRTS